MKKCRSQTKNLVILYQKLFNLGVRKYQCENLEDSLASQINIRKCSGVGSFRNLLIKYPQMKKIMNQLLESGELLQTLVKWKGQHANMAISLKYFNKMIDIIQNPQSCNTTWTGETKVTPKTSIELSEIQSKKPLQSPNALTEPFTPMIELKETTEFYIENNDNNPFFQFQESPSFFLDTILHYNTEDRYKSEKFNTSLVTSNEIRDSNFIDDYFSF